MKKVVFCVCFTGFFFATMEVACKSAGMSLDSVQLTFLRFFLGGLVLLPIGFRDIRKRGIRLNRKDFLRMLILGIFEVPISMLCFQLGVERCNATTAAVLICMNPLFTMLLSHFFTDEKMDRNRWIAFVLCIVSAFFIIRPWNIQPGNTVAGVVLVLVGAFAFSIFTVMGKQTLPRLGSPMQTGGAFMLGSMILLVIILILGRPVVAGVAEHLPLVLYLGFVVSGLANMSLFMAIKFSDATTGSVAFMIKPVIAPFLAFFILREAIAWNSVIGIVILLCASLITMYDSKLRGIAVQKK